MNRYLQLLAVLAFALTGAVAWHVLSADPGYLLIIFRGWSVETTLVVAATLALLLLALLWLGVRLLRSPFRLLRRRRRRARERLADGLVATVEGHWQRAGRLLQKAAQEPSQQAAAALVAAQLALWRKDEDDFDGALAAARAAGADTAADVLAARRLLAAGRPGSASELLDAAARERASAPALIELHARSLVACGRAAAALALIPRLGSDRAAPAAAARSLAVEIAVAALQQARHPGELRGHWDALSRALRQEPSVVVAYAGRAHQLDDDGNAAEAIEALLGKHWSEPAVLLYGQLGHADIRQAIKRAERWLEQHPDGGATRIALGELCRRTQLWGKAEDFLQRALATAPALAWEALGRLYRDRDDAGRASQAFENALRVLRGEPVQASPATRRHLPEPASAEARNSMGLPLLPDTDGDG